MDEAGRSSVVVDNVTFSDAGTYVCIAENIVGSIRALSFVRIRGETSAIRAGDGLFCRRLQCLHIYVCVCTEPPVLKGEAHMSQTIVQGSSALLDCPIHGDPSPVIRWLLDGKALIRSLRMQALHNGSLVIYSVTVSRNSSICFDF